MRGNIPFMFDYRANPVVDLRLLKSSLPGLYLSNSFFGRSKNESEMV